MIENKACAGGSLGADTVAKAAPDGCTIGLQTVSLAINPALMPDVPTIAEAGLPTYAFETWFMVFAPAATPVIDKLNTALNQALNVPALKERMLKEGFEPIPSTPGQARSRPEKEMPVWAKLIKERGITAE